MNFKTYYRSLDRKGREDYAQKANTSVQYIDGHLIHRRKIPQKKLMNALADASNGNVTLAEVVGHFYGDENEAA